MNISICTALVPLWRHSNKEKNQEDQKNGIMRALEIADQSSLLTIAFSPLGNGVFGFSSNLCATMLQTMGDFMNKSSNSSLKKLYVLLSIISDK